MANPHQRLPSTINDLGPLSKIFPGLQHHLHRPELPFNRFELELIDPSSPLNNEIRCTLRQPNATRHAVFTIPQYVVLALLSNPHRTLTVKEMIRWIITNFPYIRRMWSMDRARGVPPHLGLFRRLQDGVMRYCQEAEETYECDVVPRGMVDMMEEDNDNKAPLPPAMFRKYFLPFVSEDKLFADMFDAAGPLGYFGLTPPVSTTIPRVSLADLSKKVKFKILSELLAFPWPISVAGSRYGDPAISVHLPNDLITTQPVLRIRQSRDLFDLFRVCREFNQLGKFVFYSTNTFLLETPNDCFFAPNRFLTRIGPENRKLIRSVDFNLFVDKTWVPAVRIIETFRMLSESYCLQFLTMRIHVDRLPEKARQDVAQIPGLKDLVKFKGVRHVTIFNSPKAQEYVDEHLGSKVADMEYELANLGYENQRLDQEDDNRYPTATTAEIQEARRVRKNRWSKYYRNHQRAKQEEEIETQYLGPAMPMVTKVSSAPKVLDEVVVKARAGYRRYSGPDPKLCGPQGRHSVVYDMDGAWEREHQAELTSKVEDLRLCLKAKRAGFPFMSKYTSVQPATQNPWFDLDGLVDWIVALEEEYKKTMSEVDAKKAVLRQILGQVYANATNQ